MPDISPFIPNRQPDSCFFKSFFIQKAQGWYLSSYCFSKNIETFKTLILLHVNCKIKQGILLKSWRLDYKELGVEEKDARKICLHMKDRFSGWSASNFSFPDPVLSWIPLLSSSPKWSTWECELGGNEGIASSAPLAELPKYTLRETQCVTDILPRGSERQVQKQERHFWTCEVICSVPEVLGVEWKRSS